MRAHLSKFYKTVRYLLFMNKKSNKKSLLQKLGESQVWKSIIRSGVPRTRRQRMHAILGSVFLH